MLATEFVPGRAIRVDHAGEVLAILMRDPPNRSVSAAVTPPIVAFVGSPSWAISRLVGDDYEAVRWIYARPVRLVRIEHAGEVMHVLISQGRRCGVKVPTVALDGPRSFAIVLPTASDPHAARPARLAEAS